MGSFADQLKRFEDKSKGKMETMFHEVASEIVSDVSQPQPGIQVTGGDFQVGKIPVVTGYLRESLVTQVEGGSSAQGPSNADAVIRSAEMGDTIRVRWTAGFARHLEEGHGRIRARGFMRANLAKFNAIVNRVARRLYGQ